MKVLLVGGGGREHALGWKIAQSPILSKLFVAPGNPGLNQIGEKVDIKPENISAICDFAVGHNIDLVVVGPEAPLALGLADCLADKNIACFGASKAAARLEASKAFTKEICEAASAPTASYRKVKSLSEAKDYLETLSPPYVIKADGLAAGKGVVIANSRIDAEQAAADMLNGQFGEASATLVIEEFMQGEEVSFFAFSDGERLLPLVAVQDHKRAFDGDKGPNTGGMGAYSPAPIFTDTVLRKTMDEIIKPVIHLMRERGTPYRGVLYAGLMIHNDQPRLVEFNARFGDPECQVLMRLLEGDLLPVLAAAANGDLSGHTLAWRNEACANVVLAAKGYPADYEKGSEIKGIDGANGVENVVVFHAGTKQVGAQLVANGGRVLNVTATGKNLQDAVSFAYHGVNKIDWPQGFHRRDIAWRALSSAE
ncbi:MAG: phosphoribosylamine--glycine ligase [Pseudomonadota bacterium]